MYFLLGLLSILSLVIIWIIFGPNGISLLLGIVTIILFSGALNAHTNIGKSITIFSTSIEICTRRSHEILTFEEIISIKFQYQELVPGFYAFHPVDVVHSFFSLISRSSPTEKSVLHYQIETEEHIFYDEIYMVDYDDLTTFIHTVQNSSGISPLSKDFQTLESYGTLYYFSFKELHTDLDPDVVRDLI